ncbi:MAG: hypothetical protein O7D30_03665, partial [Rickettsia endosymbiont of Ixodes persulcatus]|nr:hypothetical protein [Rickettsia endosymbiont of Ixodes persulcatus]
GHIFIGDVINYLHLKNIQIEKLLTKEINHLTYQEFLQLVEKNCDQNDELFINSDFFYSLKRLNPRITHVEVTLKKGKFYNEMNCFRYDVVLYIDRKPTATKKMPILNWQEDTININSIKNLVSANDLDIFCITNIPNQRVAEFDYFEQRNLAEENWLENYEDYAFRAKNISINPDMLVTIAKEFNYDTVLVPSQKKPAGYFDFIAFKTTHDKPHDQYLDYIQRTIINTNLMSYANNPLTAQLNHELISQLKSSLYERLPSYMVPRTIMVIKEMPLTMNGKIDRKFLAKLVIPIHKKQYISPHTVEEMKMIDIWKSILGISEIGIHD